MTDLPCGIVANEPLTIEGISNKLRIEGDVRQCV